MGKIRALLKRFNEHRLIYGLATGLGCVCFIVAVLYLARGWIRSTIIPRSFYAMHHTEMQRTSDESVSELNKSLDGTGITFDKERIDCHLDIARKIKESVNCSAISFKRFAGTNRDINQQRLKAASEVLKKQGWTYSIDTFGVENAEAHVVYTFGKRVNGMRCSASVGDEDANSLFGTAHCSQNFHFLGDPYKSL